jgi:hypothetical protein
MTYLLLIPPLAMVAVLAAMGRPWWCGCGEYTLYTTGAAHYSQHLADSWTFSHVFHGGFFYGAFRGFLTKRSRTLAMFLTLSVEVVWEIAENTRWVIEAYRQSGDRFYKGDSIPASLGDLGACFVGALILCFIFSKAKGNEA